MTSPISLDSAQAICARLKISESEIAQYLATGEVRFFESSIPPAFGPIHQESTGCWAAHARVRYRHLNYAEELDLVTQRTQQGQTQLNALLHEVRAFGVPSDKKAKSLDAGSRYDTNFIYHPFFGGTVPIPIQFSRHFHHFLVMQTLFPELHEDLDVVFEIGSGIGDTLVELASVCPWKNIEFVGGEIAWNGLACLKEFSRLVSPISVRGLEFDILNPDFAAVCAPGKRALVFSYGVLIYANPFPSEFFEKLLDHFDEVTVVVFEMFSFSLTETLGNKPLFDRNRAISYGFCENLWSEIVRLAELGKISIDVTVPDFTGKSFYSSASLTKFRKVKSSSQTTDDRRGADTKASV